MTPVSKEAFAVTATCPDSGQCYGITVDKAARNAYRFIWAFRIDRERAKREKYDTHTVKGSVDTDAEYPGCPYCGSKQVLFCHCGAIICWKGQSRMTCPQCGRSGTITQVEAVSMRGGGY